MDERRITVGDIIDLYEFAREGKRHVKIIDSHAPGGGSDLQTDCLLLRMLEDIAVDSVDAKNNQLVIYLDFEEVEERWRNAPI